MSEQEFDNFQGAWAQDRIEALEACFDFSYEPPTKPGVYLTLDSLGQLGLFYVTMPMPGADAGDTMQKRGLAFARAPLPIGGSDE